MITLSTSTSTDHPDPFKRLNKHHHHHPIPIRSPAAKVDVFYQGPVGGGSGIGSASTRAGTGTGRSQQAGMDGLVRRSTTMGGGSGAVGNVGTNRPVQDQNSTVPHLMTSTSTHEASQPLKGIAGLEARRNKLAFGAGGGSGVPSPFARSNGLNRGVSTSATRSGNPGTPRMGQTSTSTATTTGIIPDPSPAPDVFYDPTTKPSTLQASPRPASPFATTTNSAASRRPTRPIPSNNTGTPNLLFKPPAPPSQMKRPGGAGAGTPILPSTTSRSLGGRTALNALPTPGVSNVHLNGGTFPNAIAGPSASKRRKTEMGGIPIEPGTTSASISITNEGKQQHPTPTQHLSKQEAYAEYRTRYTKAFPSFVFCFDWELVAAKPQRTDKGFSVKDCKEGIRRMGGVSF